MLSFKKILAPVNLSKDSPKIAPYIQAMAAGFSAEIHLLFVTPFVEYFIEFYIPRTAIAELEVSLLSKAQMRLDRFKNTYFKNWPKTRNTVMLGDVPRKIIEYTKANKMELLIMGTHSGRGHGRSTIGTITKQVVNRPN